MLSFGVQFYVAVVYLEKKLKLEVVRTEFLSLSFSALALNSCDLITSLLSIASVFITEELANACAILNNNETLITLQLFTVTRIRGVFPLLTSSAYYVILLLSIIVAHRRLGHLGP